jgi:hypothetical protein
MPMYQASKWTIETVRGAPGEPVRVNAYSSYSPTSRLTSAGYTSAISTLSGVVTGANAGPAFALAIAQDSISVCCGASAEAAVVSALQGLLTGTNVS